MTQQWDTRCEAYLLRIEKGAPSMPPEWELAFAALAETIIEHLGKPDPRAGALAALAQKYKIDPETHQQDMCFVAVDCQLPKLIAPLAVDTAPGRHRTLFHVPLWAGIVIIRIVDQPKSGSVELSTTPADPETVAMLVSAPNLTLEQAIAAANGI